MRRSSNMRAAAPSVSAAKSVERRSMCPRAAGRMRSRASNVCRVDSYTRVSPCTRSQMARSVVHWFDPYLARVVEVTGRMH